MTDGEENRAAPSTPYLRRASSRSRGESDQIDAVAQVRICLPSRQAR